MTTLVVESVLRSLLMAGMVWTGLKLLRVRHVLAQKIAWGLVLLAALAMPLLMRWQAAHPGMALVVPVKRVSAVAAIEKKVSTIRSGIDSGIHLVPSVGSGAVALSSAPSTPAVPIVSLQEAYPTAVSAWYAADLIPLIVPAYFVIAAVLLLRLLLGLALAARIWHRAEPASPILEPRATVRISASIQSPVTIGSGIVLPANYTEWDRSKLRLVLAHERSHVRQGDFYLQLLASLYAALVWFSPLGWWLKRRLAELGEALSDRAALREAADTSSYAEVLLEFAAMPRRNFAGVTAGVGMARSSNIHQRIERILNDRSFRAAFSGGWRHAVIAALLAPCGLVLATSLLHVQAAEVVKAHAIAALQTDLHPEAKIAPVLAEAPVAVVRPRLEPAVEAAVALADSVSQSQLSAAVRDEDGQSNDDGSSDVQADDDSSQDEDSGHSFAIVEGSHDAMSWGKSRGVFIGSWDNQGELDRARTKVQGDFIWFERDGKSYVITDPALVARSKALYAPQGELGRRQAELGQQQAELGKQQGLLGAQQALVRVPTPDISKEMAELQAAVQKLAAENAQDITQERLGEMQARLGALQGKLAAAQAVAGSKQAVLGSQQGDLGAKQAELGRQQAELGREQRRIAREATQQVSALIDQAFRDGKAKPVD
jgi:beta-lactamase regulating signal transducer with metallopeptidase domain